MTSSYLRGVARLESISESLRRHLEEEYGPVKMEQNGKTLIFRFHNRDAVNQVFNTISAYFSKNHNGVYHSLHGTSYNSGKYELTVGI